MGDFAICFVTYLLVQFVCFLNDFATLFFCCYAATELASPPIASGTVTSGVQ